MKTIVLAILLTAFVSVAITSQIPIRKTVTITNQVSILAEKKQCDTAGGFFYAGSGVDTSETIWKTDFEVSCTKTSKVFDYKFNN